jgi:hypothetical protein
MSMPVNPSAIMASLPWYERAIAAVAPVYGNQRLTARVQRELFAYQGARTDRLYAPKTNAVPSESYQTARDRVVMMFEALDLGGKLPASQRRCLQVRDIPDADRIRAGNGRPHL